MHVHKYQTREVSACIQITNSQVHRYNEVSACIQITNSEVTAYIQIVK